MRIIFYTVVTISLIALLSACGKRRESNQDVPAAAPDNTRTMPDTTMPDTMSPGGAEGTGGNGGGMGGSSPGY